MAPKAAAPSKNQPSISSFFKRKESPSSSLPSTSSHQPQAKRVKREASPSSSLLLPLPPATAAEPIVIDDTPSPSPPGSPVKRPSAPSASASTSTSFFPTSSSSSSSRPNQTQHQQPLAGPSSTTSSTFKGKQAVRSSHEALQQFAFRPPPAPMEVVDDDDQLIPATQQQQPTPPQTIARSQRHEAFKAKLLGRNFGRRKSLDLDMADELGLGGEDGQDEGGNHDDNEDEDKDESGSRQKMKNLKEKLTAKEKGKGKEVGKGGKKKLEAVGPSGMTWTPMEKQVLEAKAAHPGMLLIFEVGYKMKFYGEDSKIAAKHLNIVSFPSRNFYEASIPVHRLEIHIKNLIANGYKVGVIRQTETAALKKAGDNRNTPFTRKLTNVYTSATYVDEISSLDSGSLVFPSAVPPSNALVAIVELSPSSSSKKGKGKEREGEEVTFGLVSVVPSTGDVLWDEFTDSSMRKELETRMTHIQPLELLLPSAKLSKPTEKMLATFIDRSSSNLSDRIRVERIETDLDYSYASSFVQNFYVKKARIVEHEGEEEVADVTEFPKGVVLALAYVIRYLEEFKLSSSLLHTKSSFKRFNRFNTFLLSATTLNNLEVYRNSDDGGQKGSLLWLLDHCSTRMGKRMLREWVGRPLVAKSELDLRSNAVSELLDDSSSLVPPLKTLLKTLPDLPRGLVRIQYGRSTPAELISILLALKRVGMFSETTGDQQFESPLLKGIVDSFGTVVEPLKVLLEAIDEKRAKEGLKAELWRDHSKYEAIADAQDMISVCDQELDEQLTEIRKILKRPSAAYTSINGVDNLIETRTGDAKKVPISWIKVSSTKALVRFHTPQVLNILKEKERHRETLEAEAQAAFLDFLGEVTESFDVFRVVAENLSTLDCLISLAITATQPGFTKPIFTDEHQLDIEGGFHPMVAALKDETYVPNDVHLSTSHGRTKIITGPNMGGKSSLVRAVALTVLLAQIGSYVPASSVKLGVHDAILTRMGANDDLVGGKSTFMVEISETSDIIRTATSKSLVILDELGRGTSTFDGMAIAEAVLHHLVTQVQSHTLFITHYPLVATSLSKQLVDVSNWHMGYRQTPRPDGSSAITFLYSLAPGLAKASFGVECARLAGVPDAVLQEAQRQSSAMEALVQEKNAVARSKQIRTVFKAAFDEGNGEDASKWEEAALNAARSILFATAA
ncbi:muts domain V-domain-containing protein [Mrakia frigida]|uniref:muts domain V-domain-containing protein n=1 Tax=Mrakia frigida TaxID=29902 RepID=UPI003FCBF218